jgi:PilX N-terminal
MRRRESGSALIITVLMMLLLGAIGISALDTVMRDQQVAGYQNRSSTAFYAAEAGVAAAKDLVRRNVLSGNEQITFADAASPVLIGDAYTYPEGQPLYYGSPDNPGDDAVESLGQSVRIAGAAGSDMRVGMGANRNNFELWRIRVAGQTPDGAIARIEAVTLNMILQAGY